MELEVLRKNGLENDSDSLGVWRKKAKGKKKKEADGKTPQNEDCRDSDRSNVSTKTAAERIRGACYEMISAAGNDQKNDAVANELTSSIVDVTASLVRISGPSFAAKSPIYM